MKKILYISVNSKPESESSSKTVARELINQVLDQCKYKVPKNKNTYVIDECKDDISEASNYKKSEECCHEHHENNLEHHHKHHEDDKCCRESNNKSHTEIKHDIKCNEEVKVDEINKDLLFDSLQHLSSS